MPDPIHSPSCYHCGLPIPDAAEELWRELDHVFCCFGCQTAFRLIHGAGLDEFYRRRDPQSSGGRPDSLPDQGLDAFDREEYQRLVVRDIGAHKEVNLLLEGIHCAACVWLNEQVLRGIPGVHTAQVNFANHRARVRWDPNQTSLAQIIGAVGRIGYRAEPYDPATVERHHRRRDRDLLLRLGVAGFGAANVMLISVALYAGFFQGMEPRFKHFFEWAAMLLATPTVFYGGWTFFRGAWSGLRLGRLTMDLPIALGALVTFSYSVTVTLTGRGEVYFDSAAMFIFILMTGRYLESAARRKAAGATEQLLGLEPRSATVIRDGEHYTVAVREVVVGDLLAIKPGEQVPVDAEVVDGSTSVDESMLTGESLPVPRRVGDPLTGGTLNVDGAVVARAIRVGADTALARIIQLVENAQQQKPPIQALADRVATRFVAMILALALATFLFWWWRDADRAWIHTVSLLIITCPCALGLAIPISMVVASGTAARAGILFKSGEVMERLVRVEIVVLDKTGTVTLGTPQVERLFPAPGIDSRELLATAWSVERFSEHPIGRALVRAAEEQQLAAPAAPIWFRNHPGYGVAGQVGDRIIRAGQPDWVAAQAGLPPPLPPADCDPAVTLMGCAVDDRWLGWIALGDQLKTDAAEAVAALHQLGLQVWLLSGDRPEVVRLTGERIGVDRAIGGVLPGGKEAVIRELQQGGRAVAMIGDGINDGPALARADVAMAVQYAADVSVAAADVVFLNQRLTSAPLAFSLARGTLRVIRQNLVLSASYNAIMIPLAAAGLVVPILAAVAMPISSLAVIGNALRLKKIGSIRGVRGGLSPPAG